MTEFHISDYVPGSRKLMEIRKMIFNFTMASLDYDKMPFPDRVINNDLAITIGFSPSDEELRALGDAIIDYLNDEECGNGC